MTTEQDKIENFNKTRFHPSCFYCGKEIVAPDTIIFGDGVEEIFCSYECFGKSMNCQEIKFDETDDEYTMWFPKINE